MKIPYKIYFKICGRRYGLHGVYIYRYVYVLGHVAIIAYDRLLLCNSLFQEVLKRSGTFEKLKKFSKIREIWARKKDPGRGSTTRGRDPDVGCRHASYTHAVLPYGIQLYPPRSCKPLACVYTQCTLCVHCVYTVHTSSCTSFESCGWATCFFWIRYCPIGKNGTRYFP